MRSFNYSKIKDKKWDSELLGLVASIYRYQGKQELYLKQRPEELSKLIEIAKIQSTEASNEIEGIVTTSVRLKKLVEKNTEDSHFFLVTSVIRWIIIKRNRYHRLLDISGRD